MTETERYFNLDLGESFSDMRPESNPEGTMFVKKVGRVHQIWGSSYMQREEQVD
jgi:hypothetical protein